MSIRNVERSPAMSLALALVALAVVVGACAPAATSAPAVGKAPEPSATTASTAVIPAGAQPCPPAGSATTLTGAGATFPAPLYTRWFDEYKKLCNVAVNYQPIGSGGGIQQHTQRLVDFGASDGILTEKQMSDAPGTLMIPMTAGAVAVVANLQGVESGKLRLTPETLSAIYLGAITKWSDSKIAADNPDLKLPDQAITVVHRSDGSGTTNIFTSYLSDVSPDWKSKVGRGNAVQWPVGIGGEGNAGVAGAVKQRAGSIGYVELAYAVQNKLTWAALRNKAGQFVEPSLDATTAAMEGVAIPDSTAVMIVNSASADAYPIAGFTWVLVYENQTDRAKAQTLTAVLWWAIHDGQKLSTGLDYAPLSPGVIAKAEAQLRKLKVDGQPILR